MDTFLSWFKGIKGKLLLSAMVPFVGFIASGLISFNGIGKLGSLLVEFQENIVPNVKILYQMRESENRFGFKVHNAISALHLNLNPEEDLKDARRAYEDFKKSWSDYAQSPLSSQEQRNFDAVKEDFPRLVATMEKILQLLERREEKSLTDAQKMIQEDFVKYGSITGKFAEATLASYTERAISTGEMATTTRNSVNFWTGIVIATATLVALMLSLWTSVKISGALSSIASRLDTSSKSVTSSVEQLTHAGNSLSLSSTEAAASLEETVASLEEMSSMVQLNSDNAKQAAALSVSSREAAEKGEHEIEKLILAMKEISTSSKKIEEIISVIDDIAFQTNLLALNASVEAARAGEQGKGFAVVAEAVQALAQRSADAAKDINVLIKDSVHKVEQGGTIAGTSGAVLHNIVNSVKKVADLNTEIASASAEQTAGIQQVSKAMNQLDQSAQSNATSAEEIAATSAEISNLAVTSHELTEELSLVIYGSLKTEAKLEKKSSDLAFKPTTKVKTKVIAKVPIKSTTSQKTRAQEIIPFDEDISDPRAKIGTTDGF